ncbi:MAG TPA: hypothetical protein VEZ46_13665 [Mycobacteriales bacterium]|jgi:hypothetical protein|nr:hypothetical protein [Mycobacteriales bacterium]
MSEQSTYSNDPNELDGQEGVLDRVGGGQGVGGGAAAQVDDEDSQDIGLDANGLSDDGLGGDGLGDAVGTPASSDPDQMSDVSPDEMGGTGGENAGGAG